MTQKIVQDAEARMKKALESVQKELSGVRSGKATPGLLDTVRVEAYGSVVSLKEVGQVSAPEARLLTIQPWDKSLIKAISRAISTSDLGLSPTDDGQLVRVALPSLTEERRKDLVKLVSKFAEEGRVHMRQVRHDVIKDVQHQQKEGVIAEDESRRLQADIQKLTDKYVGLIDELLKKKTVEVMEV
ncbi:MAG: ribosome recycling factor [Candidatus Eisenbacteria bacterium]|uniref:Ribosome-recycling factor n=1 Tax=Eiseniibacteriota bacterium TaxID=2212470 RepID=A0A849SHM6_UNCEI|nr:ribosome recycling factor [Candidatus Eisenbacteria bacterium]